jgi:hypothetical protein
MQNREAIASELLLIILINVLAIQNSAIILVVLVAKFWFMCKSINLFQSFWFENSYQQSD